MKTSNVAWCLVALVALPGEARELPPFEAARRLEAEGKLPEAFAAYLAIPGAEHAAARIARSQPKTFLPLIEKVPPSPRAELVRGDLLLAAGDRAGALASYRKVVGAIGKKPEEGWDKGFMPPDYYPVELPQQEGVRGEAPPFSLGPGSHRDNWLLRRFLALDALDDAAGEFERIWALHRKAAGEGQFNGLGLQFAIDYAYFLKRQGAAEKHPHPDPLPKGEGAEKHPHPDPLPKGEGAEKHPHPGPLPKGEGAEKHPHPDPLPKGEGAEKSLDVLTGPLLRIDMDKNPNEPPPAARRFAFFLGYVAGISRKEFVRLAYGAFKGAGKEEALVAALTKQVEGGANRARRVLARVRLHQGKIDEALAQELAYIGEAKFDAVTSAVRRGLAYEDCQKLPQAAAEYEKALALPFAPPSLPDHDEEEMQRIEMSSAPRQFILEGRSLRTQAQLHADLIARLQRVYGALGQPDKATALALRQHEADPALLETFEALDETRRRFQAAGKEAEFLEWAKRAAATAPTPNAKANLHWLLGDAPRTIEAVAAIRMDPQRRSASLEDWKQRFRKAGPDKLRLLLRALVAADPTDARSRLELLDLGEPAGGDEELRALELLLDNRAGLSFESTKGSYNRTRFRNWYDLAYRLMRLYEARGQLDKLRALGLRFATGATYDPAHYRYRDENSLPEDIAGCLALLIQHADEATLAALEKALEGTPQQEGAKRQLARRKAGGWKPAASRAIGWANLPKGVNALVSCENVLSLACDERHIYAGMPWGIAVYSHKGEPVTRVALAAAARDLAVQGGHLWAATPRGLFRVAVGSWEVARVDLTHDGLDRGGAPLGAHTVAAAGGLLWIGTHSGIQRLDTRTNTLRVYSKDELHGLDGAGSRFLFDREYVWASGRDASLRYDRASDTWAPVTLGERGVGLITFANGLLWGHAWLNDKLRDRPCIVDPNTLEVTPILIEGKLSPGEEQINGPFSFYGTLKGEPVLGTSSWRPFRYDPAIRKLRPLPESPDGRRPEFESDLLPGLRGGEPWRRPDGVIVCSHNDTHHHEPVPGFRFGARRWLMARLPGGTLVLGGSPSRSPDFDGDARREWPEAYEAWDEEGGLYLLPPASSHAARGTEKHPHPGPLPKGEGAEVRRVSSFPATDSLPGDAAFRTVFATAGNHWVCTSRGLAALSAEGAVTAHFTRADGLIANRVVSGVELRGKTYFATGWGDHGGGLIVFDPKTAVFTALVQSDGLATDKLGGVAADGKALTLVYDLEYGRGGNYGYRLFPPSTLDPDARVRPSDAPALMDSSGADRVESAKRKDGAPVPCIGGFVIAEQVHEGRRYLCGTRGLVILDAGTRPELAFQELAPKVVLDPAIEQRRAAQALRPQVSSPNDLARYLESDNPFVRAEAMASIRKKPEDFAAYVPLFVSQCQHPNLRVRSTALYWIAQADDAAAVPILRKYLDDRDRLLRAIATIHLTRRGQAPDESHLRAILKAEGSFGNLLYGASYTHGSEHVDTQRLLEALAPHAIPQHLPLLMEFPIPDEDHAPRQAILKELGKSLLKHPEAADMLLKAYDPQPSSRGQVRFAQAVFAYAGPTMVPTLHKALASPDRVVRSNAARACGQMGDPSSIPHVLKALDLESGLARASIVWALGKLKAKEALPHLARFYVDARNDERRRAGSGFRGAQAQAAIQAQYDSISNLDAVGADWDEVKSAATPKPIDPQRHEDLLRPDHILAAVREIGPAASQDFYRALAGERDAEGRCEAAIQLAQGGKDDLDRNLVVLRQLLADAEISVRVRAAASLLILKQDIAQRTILEWLTSPNDWEKAHTLEQLGRVKDASLLRFARDAIQAIANDPNIHYETRAAAQRLAQSASVR
ncbi:MAG: hypothetical protein FJ291_26225 [Planctomycetes bacterium]|nr:hypothetical protein [Planctomycetota bacterium]